MSDTGEGVSEQTLDDLHEMAGTCAVKGKLLRELIDEIKETRQLLRESKPALAYVIDENDGWIKCAEESLLDPDFGSALSNYEQFIFDEKEDLRLRKQYATELRALAHRAGELT